MRLVFRKSMMLLTTALLLAVNVAHAETHSGGVGPDGRPIAPGASQAKLFQLVNACLQGRGGAAGIGAGLGAAINPGPGVVPPTDLSAGVFAPPALLPADGAPPAAGAAASASGGGDATRGNSTFNAKCLSCHGPGRPQQGLRASGAKALGRISNAAAPMPPSGLLSASEQADVAAFIRQSNGIR